jgi:shikimate kinase
MAFLDRAIVLVGLMGSGKTRVGTELARLLDIGFVDADREIEESAGMTIPEIFERFGEPEFRKGERKVMLRLLAGPPQVIASGGGAFIQEEIRAAVKQKAVSVWLKAELATLVERVSRTDHRPLLRNTDPAVKLKELMDARYPVYAEADITVETGKQSAQAMAKRIKAEIEKRARSNA